MNDKKRKKHLESESERQFLEPTNKCSSGKIIQRRIGFWALMYLINYIWSEYHLPCSFLLSFLFSYKFSIWARFISLFLVIEWVSSALSVYLESLSSKIPFQIQPNIIMKSISNQTVNKWSCFWNIIQFGALSISN